MCRYAGRVATTLFAGGVYTSTRTSGASGGPGMNRSSQPTACSSGERGGRVMGSIPIPARTAPSTCSLKSSAGRKSSIGSSSGATSRRVPAGPLDLLFPAMRLPHFDQQRCILPGAGPWATWCRQSTLLVGESAKMERREQGLMTVEAELRVPAATVQLVHYLFVEPIAGDLREDEDYRLDL